MERNYFASNYPLIRLPKQVGATELGLRRGQLGAIFALSAHFTTKHAPAIVVMPTGAGKTASLMLCPFMEGATRVLVVTPSQLLRDQIAEDFSSLAILRKVGVVPESVPSPRVHQARHRLQARDDWDELREFDVVVTTPNTISPVLEGVFPAPTDLFDLLLVDEAHHSPATTWKAVLDAFPEAKRALFTATPFRRDRKHIKGSLVFNYSLSEARRDKIFGDISFVPVNPEATDDPDITIARQVEEALREDRSNNLNHSILVRADSKARGEELLKKYEASTTLKMALIHSGHTATRVRESIAKLKSRELDAVICVGVLTISERHSPVAQMYATQPVSRLPIYLVMPALKSCQRTFAPSTKTPEH